MVDNGSSWIKLYRQLVEDPVFFNSTGAQVKVLLALLCLAGWKDTQWDIYGEAMTIRPGQVMITERRLADMCGKDVSRGGVRKALERFTGLGVISTKKEKYGTLVTVKNWEKKLLQNYKLRAKQSPEETLIIEREKDDEINEEDNMQKETEPAVAPSESPARAHREPINIEGKKDRRVEEDLNTLSGKPDVGSEEIQKIVEHLNEKTGKRFKAGTPKTIRLIKARFKEGFTVEDFRRVIDKKTDDWIHSKQMARYLRPETLFGSKFEGYLNQGEGKQGERYQLPEFDELIGV